MNSLENSETLDRLKEKFRDCWARGAAWRLEVGELLHKIKEKCDYGDWKAFYEGYGIAKSTADDYIRRYKEEALETAEPRRFDTPEPVPELDHDAENRKRMIEAEKRKRAGRKPVHHRTALHIRLKDLSPDHVERYYLEKQENPGRIQDIWLQAFHEIIGQAIAEEDELVKAKQEALRNDDPGIQADVMNTGTQQIAVGSEADKVLLTPFEKLTQPQPPEGFVVFLEEKEGQTCSAC